MKVLFLCGSFDDMMEKEILKKSKSTVHYAANKFQWNLIDGFLGNNNIDLEVLSAPFIGAFPRGYMDINIKGEKTTYKNRVKCNYVKFNNIWGYKSVSRKKNLIKEIKRFAFIKHENKNIIIYSPHTPFLQAAVYAKKIDPSIHICLVVPDLPQFMNLNEKRSFIYDGFKKIDIDIFNKNSKFVDSFVLLTEPMKNILNIGDRPFVVIEGIVNAEDIIDNTASKVDNVMSVVYTGTLNKKFGVVNLVQAFHEMQSQDVCLKICGRGDSEDIIKTYALKDERIKFLGQISNDKAVEIQKQATILVNPRQNNEEFTKYSFPSKNMEYLLTGKPVIAYKLDGIPDDYDNYFYYVKDDSIDTLAKTIEKVLSLTEEERLKFGEEAKGFVLKEKNNYKASKKIIDMIQENRGR